MKKQEITELLEHTEQYKIFSFIAEYAEEDALFYEKIKKTLLPPDDDEEICDIDYYREKAEDCFDFDTPYYRGHHNYNYDFCEAASKAASGLDSILDDASYYVEQGKYADAAAMAMAVTEVIPQNAEDVDDSDAELSDTFGTAIELLCTIVNSTGVATSIKQEIYDWSKEESNNSIYSDYGLDEIQTIYEICCEQLGDPDEVLADIDRQIKEAKNEYHKKEAVLRKIRFMQSKNMDIQAVIQTYIDINEVRKIRFEQLTNDKKYDDALLLAEQGIEIAQQQGHPGTIIDWKKSMFDVYLLQGDTAKLLAMAEYLFFHVGYSYSRDEFYNVLKKHTSVVDWPDTMERLLAPAEKGHGFDTFAARILHEHQLWPRLFALCQKGSIYDMERYEEDLKPHFEEEILEYYHTCVEKKARVTDPRAYDEVARILKRMRTFTGGNELVNQLLENYRVAYKRRRIMMEVLKEV